MMRHTVLLFFLSLSFINASSQEVKMDIFLNKTALKNTLTNVNFINSIDYTPNGFLLLASTNQFYLLGLEDIAPVFNETTTKINAFTITQDDALWIVSGNQLYTIDTLGEFYFMYDLPLYNPEITSGNNKNVAYIFDRTFQKEKEEYIVYQISDTEVYARLLSVPTPVLSLFEYETALLLSTENTILCADSKTKIFFELFSLPQNDNIISITGDTEKQAIYFSTQDTIYRIMEGELEYICTDFGGILKYDGEGLLIFNPEEKLIVRFRNNVLY